MKGLKNSRVLIVDDDPDVLTAVKLLLKPEVKEVVTDRNPENIRKLLSRTFFDLILLDMNFKSAINTGNEGLFWLRQIKELSNDTEVIMITAYGDIDLAVKSLKEGAIDFVVKPWHNTKLMAVIKDTLGNKGKDRSGSGSSKAIVDKDSIIGSKLLGQSEAMKDIFVKIGKIAPTDANVLILGENGTGKDLIAQAIYEKSLRQGKPFVRVDVGALTESLFESELFGAKKGAYTDAREDRVGRFEAAHTGTIFLDEIGNISLQQQTKLLSVFQNRQISKLGSNQPIDIDIRLICATNKTMAELGDEDQFRRDLIYRINTVEIVLPPLRNRKEDIPLLANHYAAIYSEKYFKPEMEFDAKAMDKLINYHFPGNVRELQYAIERAVIMADGDVIAASDLLFSPIESPKPQVTEQPVSMNLDELEKQTIINAIDKHHGNITKAAKELGLTRTALYRRLHKYGL